MKPFPLTGTYIDDYLRQWHEERLLQDRKVEELSFITGKTEEEIWEFVIKKVVNGPFSSGEILNWMWWKVVKDGE